MSNTTNTPAIAGFAFATCMPESNAWLKRDVARLHPQLRLAFSRPGFVSWKADELLPGFQVQSPVAGVCGWGSGHTTDFEVVAAKVAALWTTESLVHVFAPGRELDTTGVPQTVSALRAWSSASGHELVINVRAPLERRVIDVIVLEPERWFVGWHTQHDGKFRGPGGVPAHAVDEASPSRAYAKVAELLALGELDVRPGESVVELGAAPGGGTLFLLQQGARVWAIDPAPLAQEILAFGQSKGALTPLQMAAGEITRQQLPKRVDYLVSDVNLAPTVSLRYLERLCALVRGPRRGLLVNLKVNDEKAEALLPAILDKVRDLGRRVGLPQMRVAQLPSHRREIGVVLRRTAHTAAMPKSDAHVE